MFHAVKVKKFSVTVFSLACVVIFVLVCLLALRGGLPQTVNINGEDIALRAENADDLRAFLAVCGNEDAELLSEREITVPKHWNEVYSQYNELQRAQGLDLTSYKGKRAAEYNFAVDADRNAAFLVADGGIIATHLCGCDGSVPEPLWVDSQDGH